MYLAQRQSNAVFCLILVHYWFLSLLEWLPFAILPFLLSRFVNNHMSQWTSKMHGHLANLH